MMTVIRIRPAVEDDSTALFEWRNDEVSRQASISQDPVARDDHDRWFASSLASSRRSIYLAIDDESGERVGMCRFDLDESGSTAEVSINLNPVWRGHGLAGEVLALAIERYGSSETGRVPLTATIRSTNPASARIFVNAGFALDRDGAEFAHYQRPGITSG
jgi:RimJ/RimL family protein N-acetyltransferase